MKKLPKRLTYANVMSSIAVFLVLGGASAVAAKKIGSNELKSNSVTTAKIKKNAVTAAKIKKNAVTTAKIKNGAVTGAKVNLGSLGTVPSADTANSLTGRIPISVYIGNGTQNVATVGPFTIRVECKINNEGDDEGEFQLLTSVDGAAMDDNNGAENSPFDISDNPAGLYFEDTSTGELDIEVAEEPGLIAVAPDGTAIVLQNQSIGFNLTGHPGQCYFGALLQKIG